MVQSVIGLDLCQSHSNYFHVLYFVCWYLNYRSIIFIYFRVFLSIIGVFILVGTTIDLLHEFQVSLEENTFAHSTTDANLAEKRPLLGAHISVEENTNIPIGKLNYNTS